MIAIRLTSVRASQNGRRQLFPTPMHCVGSNCAPIMVSKVAPTSGSMNVIPFAVEVVVTDAAVVVDVVVVIVVAVVVVVVVAQCASE